MAKEKVTLAPILGLNMSECSKCFTKRSGDGSWVEIVRCALHDERELEPIKKHFRVTWIEKYEKIFEAETEEAAIENRDDDDAFQGWEEVTAQEVARCGHCDGTGQGRRGGSCGVCEDGWTPVIAKGD